MFFFSSLQRLYFYVLCHFACVYVCEGPAPQELDLQMHTIVSCLCGCCELNWGLLEEQPLSR